jgi:hypothetical protein
VDIDQAAIEYFRIRIGRSVRKEHPNMTFGTATIRAGTTSSDIAHGLASIPSNVSASESANSEKAQALENEIKEAKERIKKWAEEETLGLQEISDPEALFNFALSTGTGRTLHVIQGKSKRDSVAIVASIIFGNNEKSRLRSKTTIERREILSRLRFALSSVDAEFHIDMETEDIPKSIRIVHPIYYDALTKDRFMHALFIVLKALELANWIVIEVTG